MMTMKGLDYWRSYFRTANSDIFDILENGIMVAAYDCPKEFKLRRDRIAELLFSCKLSKCFGCERVELSVPYEDAERNCVDKNEFAEAGGSKESKVNSVSRDDHDHEVHDDRCGGRRGDEIRIDHQVSNYSYGEAEALTDEIEEESQVFDEVLRIKEILFNSQDESDDMLYESLRKLQLMALTVDTLKATEIGKAVNGLRKHGVKEIRHLARTLIDLWKEMVDEWVNSTAAIAEGTPDSVNPSALDEDEEEGLPSPPLDEGAFFATSQTTMELSQFFDGMDDDGNPRNSGEFIKNRENVRKPAMQNQIIAKRKQQSPYEVNVLSRDDKGHQLKKQEAVVKLNKPSSTESGPGRPPKVNMQQKITSETKYHQNLEKATNQRRPSSQQDKLRTSDEVSVQVKLEATKRKLQESYQQAEKAKKQRTIQVMELQDLPKQGLGNRNPNMKPGSHNRHWANGRR